MTTTIHSTTGTAPITFTRTVSGLMRVDLPDGSSQVYDVRELTMAVLTVALGVELPQAA